MLGAEQRPETVAAVWREAIGVEGAVELVAGPSVVEGAQRVRRRRRRNPRAVGADLTHRGHAGGETGRGSPPTLASAHHTGRMREARTYSQAKDSPHAPRSLGPRLAVVEMSRWKTRRTDPSLLYGVWGLPARPMIAVPACPNRCRCKPRSPRRQDRGAGACRTSSRVAPGRRPPAGPENEARGPPHQRRSSSSCRIFCS